jgi:hypothetical protein
MSLNCGHKQTYCSSPDYISMESRGGMILTGESEELACLSALCPSQVPHGLTRLSAVRGW